MGLDCSKLKIQIKFDRLGYRPNFIFKLIGFLSTTFLDIYFI